MIGGSSLQSQTNHLNIHKIRPLAVVGDEKVSTANQIYRSLLNGESGLSRMARD